jgi:dihydroorotase
MRAATRLLRLLPHPLLLAAALGCAGDPPYDVVLANGRVMDPATGMDSLLHVGIRGDSIAALSAAPLEGREVVDVTGLVVAPGFIDLHAHGLTRGDMEIQAEDGVTTALDMEAGAFPVQGWYASMEGKAPLNFGVTVGHRPARTYVFHDSLEVFHGPVNTGPVLKLGPVPAGANAPATEAQLTAIEGAIHRGLDEGALGVGFGINYSPGATTQEIERMFRVAAQRQATAFVHTRAFGIGAIREAVEAARAAQASLHLVHIASSSLRDLPEALALVDSARAAGMDVTTEAYPYTAGSTRLESAMFNPGWQKNLPVDYGDLAWPLTGERLTRETFDRYRAQGGWVVIHMMTEENVAKAIAHPGVMIASDGVLGRYVREQRALPLMDALARMTILPAQRLERIAPVMRRKGRVSVGAHADLAVFNPATVIDHSTFDAPATRSSGMVHVLVNGTFVVRGDALVEGALPGRAVKSGVAQ